MEPVFTIDAVKPTGSGRFELAERGVVRVRVKGGMKAFRLEER